MNRTSMAAAVFLACSLIVAPAAEPPADVDASFALIEVARREPAPPKTPPENAPQIRVGHEWKPSTPWAWLVGELILPATVGGVETTGKPLGLRISCAQGGAVFVDGILQSRFDNDKPALVLASESAQPGRRIRLAIQTETRGGGDRVRFGEARWDLLAPERACQPLELTIDSSRAGGRVPDGIVGLSQGGTMADYEEATAACLKQAGFKWFRMDNVLTSSLRESDGVRSYDFAELDRRLDFIAKVGAMPIMAASYMPQALDAVPDNERHSAPRDYAVWEELCYQAARHALERGTRVPCWEVWNEPNTGWIKPGPSDTGAPEFMALARQALEGKEPSRDTVRTLEAYLKLYRATARGVRRADPQAQVGGPALASGPFENAERGHCFNGKLFARGLLLWCAQEKLPLDFVSWHEYFHPPEVFIDEFQTLRAFLRAFPDLERQAKSFYITEWNEAWWADPPQDNELGAAWCANILTRAVIPSGVVKPCLFYAKQGDRDFRGDYSVILGGNLPKPQYHVASIFNRLRGVWLEVACQDGEVSCAAAWDSSSPRLAIVLVNHTDRYNLPRRVRLKISSPVTGRLREYRIDATHSNAYEDLNRADLAVLGERSCAAGEMTFETRLPAHAVSLVELVPAHEGSAGK